MPDPASLPSSLLVWLPTLGAAFAAGSVTQLARQFARAQPPGLRTILALGVAAGIAALTVVALLGASVPTTTAPALLLAAACITGWSGPGILARLGSLVERRLGLPVPSNPLDEPDHDQA